MKSWNSQVEKWLLDLDVYSLDVYESDVMRVSTTASAEKGLERLDVRFWTHTHAYHIWATPHVLGCEASCRTWRSGENWHRGSDLGDGPVSKDTWEYLKKRILRYELVAPEPEIKQPPVPQTESVAS